MNHNQPLLVYVSARKKNIILGKNGHDRDFNDAIVRAHTIYNAQRATKILHGMYITGPAHLSPRVKGVGKR